MKVILVFILVVGFVFFTVVIGLGFSVPFWVEILEPDDLRHVFPVVLIEIGAGHDDSEAIVKFVQDQL